MFVVFLIIFSIFSSGFAQTKVPAREAKHKKIFKLAVGGPIRSIDPAQIESNSELMLASNLGETLLGVNALTGLLEPRAAKEFSVSDNGLTLTIRLRDDLTWSNGEKVQAEDFVFSMLRLIDPSSDSWIAPMFSSVRSAAEFHEGAVLGPGQVGIHAIDSKTIVMDLKKRDPFLPFLLAQPPTIPVHKKTIDRFGKLWTRPEHWVGNGPYIPTQIGKSAMVFSKNGNFHGSAQVATDEVQIFLVASPQEGVELYRSNAVDQFGYRDFEPTAQALNQYSGQKDLVFEPDFHTYFIRLNTSKPPFSLRKFREVLAMAIDRNILTQSVTLNNEAPAYSMIHPAIRRYDPPSGYLFNESGARVQLKELGYCVKGYSPKGCQAVPFLDLLIREGELEKKVALTLESMWKRVLGNDHVKIVSKPSEAFLKAVAAGDFMMVLDDMAVEPEKAFDLLFSFRSGRKSAGSWSNATYDKLLDEALDQAEWQESKKIFREAEALLLKEGGVIPLFHGNISTLVSPRVKGFVPNIWDLHPFAALSLF